MIFSGHSHVGLKRNQNEDFYLIDESLRLAIVCDGMGGHEMGDFASRSVAQTVSSLFSRLTENDMSLLDTHSDDQPQPVIKRIFYAVQLANLRLLHIADANRLKKGMGTTIVGLHVFRDSVIVFHVGDSRCYRLREGAFECLTKDHSFAQNLLDQGEISLDEYHNFDKKNVITRAMGMGTTVKVDIAQYPLQKEDTFLLCTDGLWGLVDDRVLHSQLLDNLDDIPKIPSLLIDAANAAGGDDNITNLVVHCNDPISVASEAQPSFYALSIHPSDVARYDAVLNRYFSKRKWTNRPYLVASIGMFLVLAAGFLLMHFQSSDPKDEIETAVSTPNRVEQARIPDQTVYFYLDFGSKPEWRNAQVIVDGKSMGSLLELQNGLRIQPGHYSFSLVLQNDTLYQDRFECVVDPTGERNLVEIQSD